MVADKSQRVLWFEQEHWEQMASDVQDRLPEEACGLIGGLQAQVFQVFPIQNTLHSPVRFRLDPKEQVDVFNLLEKQGWELIGIYHSHPAGPSYPSLTDIAESAYPDTVYLIWFPQGDGWVCRGFIIHDGSYHEVRLGIKPGKE